jgi:hypothetical protein
MPLNFGSSIRGPVKKEGFRVTSGPHAPNDPMRALCSPIQEVFMNKRTIITTAAAIFAAGTFASSAFAAGVKCAGANSCKGHSACKSATNACKGQNACKGKGFTEASDAKDCAAKGGKVM